MTSNDIYIRQNLTHSNKQASIIYAMDCVVLLFSPTQVYTSDRLCFMPSNYIHKIDDCVYLSNQIRSTLRLSLLVGKKQTNRERERTTFFLLLLSECYNNDK